MSSSHRPLVLSRHQAHSQSSFTCVLTACCFSFSLLRSLGLDKAVEEAKSRYVKRPAQPCHPAQPRVASLRQAAHCLNSSLLTLARYCVPVQDVALQCHAEYAVRLRHELLLVFCVHPQLVYLRVFVFVATHRVVPPQLLLYMALAPEEKIKYSEGGPQATANFDAGVAGYEARAFRGCGVFSSTPVRATPSLVHRLGKGFCRPLVATRSLLTRWGARGGGIPLRIPLL